MTPEPFDFVAINLDAVTCEECEGGFAGVEEVDVVSSLCANGSLHIWHAACAPAPVRRMLLWAALRDNAWLN